jgi:hypothetical protein
VAVLAAVQADGGALPYASEGLRERKDIVLVAVTKTSMVLDLEYASARDRAFGVCARVNASPDLRGDKERERQAKRTFLLLPALAPFCDR